MPSRRTFLTTVATGTVASIAGCGVLDSGGGSDLDGEQWATEDVARISDESDAEPVFDSVTVKAPSRVASEASISESIRTYQFTPTWTYDKSVTIEDIDRSIFAEGPRLTVDVGDFSASEATPDIDSNKLTEIESDLDASVFFYQWHGATSVYAAADGLQAWTRELTEPEQADAKLEPILAAADGAGDSLLTSEPAVRLSEHLEDGIYARYWDVGGEEPVGLSVAIHGDTARRRIVQVWSDERAASESRLLDEELRSVIEARDYRGDSGHVPPVEGESAERDGRVVKTEVTLPVEALVWLDFKYPLNVDWDPF